MKLPLYELYKPITAKPFENNETYMEIEPCDELKPYIRCFWGMPVPYSNIKTEEENFGLITPDTCMDIIFSINYTDNYVQSSFCGINDIYFSSSSKNNTAIVSTFAIRFYFWAVPLFAEESMSNVLNSTCDIEEYFPKLRKELEHLFFDISKMNDRIKVTEKYLLDKINKNKENINVMNSVYQIINKKGNIEISELEQYSCVSKRHLERLFKEYIGVSPKKLSNLVRYQYLWQEIIYNQNFDIQDAILTLGYNDQSHLINDFKRYHSLTPKQARDFALK